MKKRMTDWQFKAKMVLKKELKRRKVTYAKLTLLLNGMGLDETLASVCIKMSRGTFSVVFLLQCLKAIGCKDIRVED